VEHSVTTLIEEKKKIKKHATLVRIKEIIGEDFLLEFLLFFV
jgi:hypothetical protein